MLVLSRKVGQSILVGDVEIKVVQIRSGAIRLAIQADKDLKILRKELAEEKPKSEGDEK